MPKESRFALSLTRGFWLWVALWIGALIFTQALLSSASNIFFSFVCALPIVSLVYLLIARATIKLLVPERRIDTEKNTPLVYEMQLTNESFLPYPFVDAVMRLPTERGVRTIDRCVRISMPPNTLYSMKNTVCFPFRGTYQIGVRCIYVYDVFRIFRMRIDVNSYGDVCVLPRRLSIFGSYNDATADSSTRSKRAPSSPERLEVSDVREYRQGDALKSVHWKLSSKSEELIVRDYNAGVSSVSYVFCDMSAHFPNFAPTQELDDTYRDEQNAARLAAKRARLLYRADTAKDPLKAQKLRKKAAALEKNAPPEKEKNTNALKDEELYADMNEFCADGVIETTVALTLRELRRGRSVTLLWFDRRSDIGAYAFDLHSESDLDIIFRLFATAPIAAPDKKVCTLTSTIKDTEAARLIFVLPAIDNDTVSELCNISPIISEGGAEAVLFVADERYADPKGRQKYLSVCASRLAEAGIELSHSHTLFTNNEGGKADV